MGIKKTGILLVSMTVLMTSAFLTEQAFAGFFPATTCAECDEQVQLCLDDPFRTEPDSACIRFGIDCRAALCRAVGGEIIQMETTSVLAAGAQYTAAWMIPVVVAAIGIGIVIARKF